METSAEQTKLYPLYFTAYHRCFGCKSVRVSSAVQILQNLSDRQRYFCEDCVLTNGLLLTERFEEDSTDLQGFPTKTKSQSEQRKPKPMKAGV